MAEFTLDQRREEPSLSHRKRGEAREETAALVTGEGNERPKEIHPGELLAARPRAKRWPERRGGEKQLVRAFLSCSAATHLLQ